MRVRYTGIKEAIQALEELKNFADVGDLRMQSILRRLADEGYNVARSGFDNASYPGNGDVDLKIVWVADNEVHLIATGKSVMFIEFGSGVFYPEHPWQETYPGVVPHGEYGYKNGANKEGWIYSGEQGKGPYAAMPVYRRTKNGEVQKPKSWQTWGSPPARAMYNATIHMQKKVEEIIKEVFEK